MRTLTCVDCHQAFPPSQVDMSPNGWRCQKCKLRHDIDVHSGADDQIGEISITAMRAKAENAFWRAAGAFALSIVVGLLLAAGAFTLDGSRRQTRRTTYAVAIVPSAFAWAIYELASWRRAKKAIEIAESRDGDRAPKL